MKISYNWLSRLVDLEGIDPAQIVERLPMAGIEVESVESTGLVALSNIVVGEVLEKEQHPNADKLSVCKVLTEKDGSPRQIVCGAKNFKVGDRVPVALPGAVIPGGFEIKQAQLRGVESGGMMMSARELGLGDDHSGLLILEQRPDIGTPINEVFGEGDTVLTLELTANRGDCLSHIGVAREVAAIFGKKLKLPEQKISAKTQEKPAADALVRGVVLESDNCPYYTGWSIRGVKIAPSPEWMQRDLQRVGLRPINNVVDVTNWVMYETGQPLHAFDAKKIGGQTIVVRQAKEGETILMLDGKARALSPEMLVIADAQKPLVVAGVMGSVDAEVDEHTTDIFLESAWFNPGNVRLSAKALGVSTDSSYRNARDVNPQATVSSALRAVELILETAGGEFLQPGVVVGTPPRGDVRIDIDGDTVRERLGFDVDDATIKTVFESLGFFVKEAAQGWTVTVPAFRGEVTRPIDLVEEFLRIYGTEKIPPAPVCIAAIEQQDDPLEGVLSRLNALMVGQDFSECMHYTLVDGEKVRRWYEKEGGDALALDNPLNGEQSHLRPSLVMGLVEALALNRNNGNDPLKLFETGRVFRIRQDKQATELVCCAFVMPQKSLSRSWQARTEPDFYSAKGLLTKMAQAVQVPARTLMFENLEAASWQNGHSAQAGSWQRDGWQARVGVVNAALAKQCAVDDIVFAAEIVFTAEFLKRKRTAVRYQPFSAFPSSTRDVALVVDKSLSAEAARKDVLKAARAAVDKTFALDAVELFDVYQGKGLPEGKKSLAFALVFRAEDRTLTDEEVKAAFDKVLAALSQNDNYTLRS